MTDKPWKPDWVSIGIWAVVIVGCLTIWIKIFSPIVEYLK
jgi:hypothetical protein